MLGLTSDFHYVGRDVHLEGIGSLWGDRSATWPKVQLPVRGVAFCLTPFQQPVWWSYGQLKGEEGELIHVSGWGIVVYK